MQKLDARTWMGLAGAMLIVGFFLPWIDPGGFGTASGLDMVRADFGWSFARLMLLAIPFAGAGLLAAAVTRSPHAKRISVGIGLAFIGYGVYKTVQAFFAITGIGLWITIAAALLAIAVPLLAKQKSKA